jgi:MFS family permease
VLFNQTMTQICLAWLILRLTDSAVWVSISVFAFGLPAFFLTIPAGALADRWDRRLQLMLAQLVAVVNAVVLAILVGLDAVTPGMALFFAAVSGTTIAFSQPARMSIVPLLLPPNQLLNGIVLGSLSQNLAQLTGPALAGILIATISISAALFMLAALLIAGVVALLFIQLPQRPRGTSPRFDIGELFGGVRFLWESKPLLVVIALYLATGIWIGGSIQTLVPVLVKQEYHEGASALGLAYSVQAVAAIITALWITGQGSLRYKGALFALSMWIASLAVAWYGLSPSYFPALIGFIVFGCCTAFYSNMSQTILQTHSPRHLLGRVQSILTLSIQGFIPLGALQAGLVASLIGVRGATVYAGLAAFALSSLALIFADKFRKLS